MKADGSLFLQQSPIAQEELTAKLIAIAKNGYDEQLQLSADTHVPYGRVMEVMGLLNGAGYRKLGLRTGGPDGKPLAPSP